MRNNADFEAGKVNPADLSFAFNKASMSKYHSLEASIGGQGVGAIEWHAGTGEIHQITVAPEHRRKGIATALYFQAKRVAADTRGVKPPKHSAHRTNEGEAWARTVGGTIPPRTDAYATYTRDHG
jgi:GNAT superfamily N-acetyltransferase